MLTGTRMIDFNWITDHEILAGCSGDVTFLVDVPGEFEPVPAELSVTRSLRVRGLMSGHCEFDIHLGRPTRSWCWPGCSTPCWMRTTCGSAG
ncbi:MAG: hypothetical protein U0R72_06790 [Nakamurella multipartita]